MSVSGVRPGSRSSRRSAGSSRRLGGASADGGAPAAHADEPQFQPCAATASLLLYAVDNLIICLHHDTLALDRRFDRHRDPVVWLAADNVSERSAGRSVVSYDSGQTALVWDLLTGDELARFVSYEQIRVAAWLRNGNIAFGAY